MFCRDVLSIKYDEQKSSDLDLWVDIARSCCWWWPYGNYCIVSERPTLVKMEKWSDSRYRLHCDDGPSLTFSDGWEVYSLHGVRVTEELVMTPTSELNPKVLLQEKNAEVRREIVRKVGIERLCQQLNAETMDTFRIPEDKWKGQFNTNEPHYQLLMLQIGEDSRPYLKMFNPSTGTWHIEGVPRDCKTVRESIMFRNGLRPEQIDEENGAEYEQQGDILFFPVGAKKFKLFPNTLT